MRRILLAMLLLVGLAAGIMLHGYWYSTTVIQKYIARCGAHLTLDQAIASDMRHNGYDPGWFEEYIKAQNMDGVPYTWYVIYRVKPEFQAAVNQVPQQRTACGGSFYVHARQGWVGMPEHILNAIGYLDLWMMVFRLHGG
jgi:hypothetical protein